MAFLSKAILSDGTLFHRISEQQSLTQPTPHKMWVMLKP
jgi:hypothetical protein